MKRFLTTREARLLISEDLAVSTFKTWIRKRLFPIHQVGGAHGKILIPKREFLQWLESGRVPSMREVARQTLRRVS